MKKTTGTLSLNWKGIIECYNKNETIADMYYDLFKTYEKEFKIEITIEENEDVFDVVQAIATAEEGEIFNLLKEIFPRASDYYISEENIGGESVVFNGDIIFTENETGVSQSFSFSDIFEEFWENDFLD